jgi:CheY-like chemotaxis protein
MSPPSPLPSIVVAEDSDDDLFFLKRRLKQAGIENPVVSFENGQEALRYLEQVGPGTAEERPNPRPCLIFLDIKMPLMSGLEVLAWARKQPGLADVPIVMLSGSTAESDMAEARKLGATDYLIKPATTETLAALARRGFGSDAAT